MGIFALLPAKTWAGIGFALALAAAVWGAYLVVDGRGYARCEREHQVALAAHIQRAQAQAVEIALQDAEISQSYEIWRTRTVTKVEEVTREIPADCTACRLNPHGLSLLNAARGGAIPLAADPGQPDAAMPPAAAAPGRDDAGAGGRCVDGRTAVLRLQGSAWATDPGHQNEGI